MVEVPLDAMVKHSKFMPCVVDSLRYATAFYFDRRLKEDWGLLLCMILHPCCSGYPASNSKQEPWPCLTYRFDDLWVNEGGGEWVKQDRDKLIFEVMTAGEKVLREELELQYDLEHGGSLEGEAAAAVSGVAGASSLVSPLSAPATPTSAATSSASSTPASATLGTHSVVPISSTTSITDGPTTPDAEATSSVASKPQLATQTVECKLQPTENTSGAEMDEPLVNTRS